MSTNNHNETGEPDAPYLSFEEEERQRYLQRRAEREKEEREYEERRRRRREQEEREYEERLRRRREQEARYSYNPPRPTPRKEVVRTREVHHHHHEEDNDGIVTSVAKLPGKVTKKLFTGKWF